MQKKLKKILLATDSFKGSLCAMEVCAAMKQGIKAWNKNLQVVEFPISDGGEGFSRYLTKVNRAKTISVLVQNPLFKQIKSSFGFFEAEKTAYIDVASASGITLIKPNQKNCLKASSFGTGQLIKKALDLKAKRIVLGLGGSTTTDMGVGMASALGYRFLDKHGKQVKPCGGQHLKRIAAIDDSQKDKRLNSIEVIVASDVQNPLYGENGAAHVYAWQKGAKMREVALLDAGLSSLNALIKKHDNIDLNSIKGAGAAGGLGAASIYFLGGKMHSGIDLFFELTHLKKHLTNVDLIITGEGRVDNQTLQGKAVWGLSNISKQHNIPLAVLCGSKNLSLVARKKLHAHYVASIIEEPISLEVALQKKIATQSICHATYEIMSLWHVKTL